MIDGIFLLLAGLLWPLAPGTADDQIVASAEGPRGRIEITAARLRAFAATRPEVSARASALALIEFELLAAEAEAKGLREDPQTRTAVAEQTVRRFLMDQFEPSTVAEKLDLAYVKQSYQRNIGRYKHPPLRTASHLVVAVQGEGEKAPHMPEAGGEAYAKAKALIDRIYADLQREPPADAAAFLGLRDRYTAEAEAQGLVFLTQKLGRFARKGRYAKEFTEATFAIQTAPRLTTPFETSFGFHVAYVTKIEPGLDQPFEAVEAELRERLVPEVRDLELRKLIETAGRTTGAAVDFSALAPPTAPGEPRP